MSNGEPNIPPGNPIEVPPVQFPPDILPGGPIEQPEPLPESPQTPPMEVPPAPPETSPYVSQGATARFSVEGHL